MAVVLEHRTSWSPNPRAMRTVGGFVLAGLCLVCMPASSAGRSEPIQTQAPVHVIARGFEQPTGLAVHPHGFLVLTDQETGVLYRLSPDADGTFSSEVLLAGLKEPYGVVVERDGHLLVAEKDRGQVVRVAKLTEVAFSAVPVPVVEGLKEPRWLALDREGALVVSAEGIKKDKLPKGTPKPKDEVVLRIAPDGALRVLADGFKELSGLALDHAGHLFAGATRRRDDKEKRGERIFRIQLPEGPVSPVIAGGFTQPRDLEFDVLGALFFTVKEIRAERGSDERDKNDRDDREETRSSGDRETDGQDKDDHEDRDEDERSQTKGVILKATFKADGTLHQVTRFAAGMGKPEGLTFDPDGHLYVAESKYGRVLRFQSPDSPVLDLRLPHHTKQATLLVPGTAVPDAQITVLRGASSATGPADPSTGAFSIEVPLIPNTEQTLRVYATSRGGEGLTSAATEATVTQDERSPETFITEGPSGAHSSTIATFSVTGTDNFTAPGNLQFAWRLDGGMDGMFTAFGTATSTTFANLTTGPHLFEVIAQDQAGNVDPTPAEQTFTVTGLSLTITSPAPGGPVPAGSLLVRGTVQSGGAEVGAIVNGIPAAVQGSNFAAFIPVAPDTTAVTAQATTAAGATASHTISIVVAPGAAPAFALEARPQSGVAPLSVTFSVVEGAATTNIDLDFDGDGTVDFSGADLESQSFTYTQPGLYIPTAAVIDSQGDRVTASAVVHVYDQAMFDASIQAKWASFQDALRIGDIEKSLGFLLVTERDGYRELLTALAPQLGNIDAMLRDIRFVSLDDKRAEYQMIRIDNGLRLSFFILFMQDTDGIWRLKFL